MKIIAHRKNTIEELRATPRKYGVEVDIRSQGQNLIIHHDAFKTGIDFKTWLEDYAHGTLILNVKEEGLEQSLLALLKQKGIEDFFFLDQSFPFLIKTAKAGEARCAVRVSEFEAIETALSVKGLVKWIWVDCFSEFPLNARQVRELQAAGFQLCAVSPELQGRAAETEIKKLCARLKAEGIDLEAVCTKRPELWEAE